ncbi:hypothetical protein [Shewanella frigidimarina]|uniref:hypothetical protein n=1 Tax=Shewanella frigidimarina TaxID=56812 RepID=UPI003D7A880C
MSKVKKIPAFIAQDSLDFATFLGGKYDFGELSTSSAINLCMQFAKLAVNRVPLTENELLFCCDILNGGAHLSEFETPDSANILNALNSMQFSLRDAIMNNYGQELEKWNIAHTEDFYKKINELSTDLSVSWSLALITRSFWSGTRLRDTKALNECDSYQEWAKQWVL